MFFQLSAAAFSAANYDLYQVDGLCGVLVASPGHEHFDYVLDHDFEDLGKILRALAVVPGDEVAQGLQVVVLQTVYDFFEEQAEIVVCPSLGAGCSRVSALLQSYRTQN